MSDQRIRDLERQLKESNDLLNWHKTHNFQLQKEEIKRLETIISKQQDQFARMGWKLFRLADGLFDESETIEEKHYMDIATKNERMRNIANTMTKLASDPKVMKEVTEHQIRMNSIAIEILDNSKK